MLGFILFSPTYDAAMLTADIGRKAGLIAEERDRFEICPRMLGVFQRHVDLRQVLRLAFEVGAGEGVGG